MMRCYSVRYWFTADGFGKRQFKGTVCGCVKAESKAQAIMLAEISQDTMQDGNRLVRTVATARAEAHYCDADEV